MMAAWRATLLLVCALTACRATSPYGYGYGYGYHAVGGGMYRSTLENIRTNLHVMHFISTEIA